MIEQATFGAGCFWGVEETFRKLPGVIETAVGYMGGTTENPTYEQVCTDRTGHAEVMQVTYDSEKISYEKLLEIFWNSHNPTTLNRQGPDVGTQYRSAIFYHSEAQKLTAEKVKARVQASGAWKRPVVTEIVKAEPFYPAEAYHQDYLVKNPGGYTCHYVRDYTF